MNSEYKNYLLLIIILIITIPACIVFFIYNRHKSATKDKKSVLVTGGNISAFFDRSGNVTLIPYVKDKYGNGKATSHVEAVRMPYSPDRLGNAVKKSLSGCKNDTPCTNRELLDILGINDWKQFSEDKRNISVYFREGYGLVFNTTTRKSDGAYQFNVMGVEKSMPADTNDFMLGNTLLQLMEKCR